MNLRKPIKTPRGNEAKLLDQLIDSDSPQTIVELCDALKMTRNTAKTSLMRLQDKGFVIRRKVGRAYVYEVARQSKSKQKEAASEFGRMIKLFFNGDVFKAFISHLNTEELSEEQIQELREIVDGQD